LTTYTSKSLKKKMAEYPGSRDADGQDKTDRKRKHGKAFKNKGKNKNHVNWSEKRDQKRLKAAERDAGGVNEPYESNTFTIGSDYFNEYYKVS